MSLFKRTFANTLEEFTEDLIRWVNDPETESKMPGAHARFGPMPSMPWQAQ